MTCLTWNLWVGSKVRELQSGNCKQGGGTQKNICAAVSSHSFFSQCSYGTPAVFSVPRLERLLSSPSPVCIISVSCFCLGHSLRICADRGERALLVTAVGCTGAAPLRVCMEQEVCCRHPRHVCLPPTAPTSWLGAVAALTMRSSFVFLWCLAGSSVRLSFSS